MYWPWRERRWGRLMPPNLLTQILEEKDFGPEDRTLETRPRVTQPCKRWPRHASVFTGGWRRAVTRKTKVWTARLVPSRSDSWALPPAPRLKSRTRRRSGCPRPAPPSLQAGRQRRARRRRRLRPRPGRVLRCRGSPRLLVGPGARRTEPRTRLPPRSCSSTRRPPRPAWSNWSGLHCAPPGRPRPPPQKPGPRRTPRRPRKLPARTRGLKMGGARLIDGSG